MSLRSEFDGDNDIIYSIGVMSSLMLQVCLMLDNGDHDVEPALVEVVRSFACLPIVLEDGGELLKPGRHLRDLRGLSTCITDA